MTHACGITASQKLLSDLKMVKENDIRCVQIKIENEALEMKGMDKVQGSFEDDFDKCTSKYLNSAEGCYIILRTDNRGSLGYNWIFMHWVPDTASVRDKMLYASTRSTMKKVFGEGYFEDDITGFDKEDLLLCGFKKHVDSRNAPPPLSQGELDLIEVKKAERATALDDGHRTLKSMGFPPTEELIEKLNGFHKEEFDYLEMSIEIEKEKIRYEDIMKNVTCDEVRNKIDPEKPRYFLFRFRHEFESVSYKSIIFIYNMPGYSAPVKQRMLYSSCKAPFLELLQGYFQMSIARRLELIAGDLSDLVTDNLLIDLHPPKVDNRPSYSKPKGPNNRGPKRLIKG